MRKAPSTLPVIERVQHVFLLPSAECVLSSCFSFSSMLAIFSTADFKGFAIDGALADPEADPVPRTVDVILADPAVNLQWVSLECEVMPGSTPTPDVQWIRTDTGGGNPEVLIEDFMSNTVRFIDGGEWLILETTEAAVSGKEYYCQVTNKQRFQTVRGPITYTLNPGEPLSLMCTNEVSLYIPLYSHQIPR